MAEGDTSASFGFPWSTGFEQGFCEFGTGDGYCYVSGDQTTAYRQIVTSPVHSGNYAAKFFVSADESTDKKNTNSRCVRKGVLPEDAYYGAWYYIPAVATVPNRAVWNLIHFQVSSPLPDDADKLSGIWDVSLVDDDTGAMRLVLYQFPPDRAATNAVPNFSPPTISLPLDRSRIPIGSWFNLRLHLKLASDKTGTVEFWLNDDKLYSNKECITNSYYSRAGEWYVGNLATGIIPPESTAYVDDVSVEPSLQ